VGRGEERELSSAGPWSAEPSAWTEPSSAGWSRAEWSSAGGVVVGGVVAGVGEPVFGGAGSSDPWSSPPRGHRPISPSTSSRRRPSTVKVRTFPRGPATKPSKLTQLEPAAQDSHEPLGPGVGAGGRGSSTRCSDRRPTVSDTISTNARAGEPGSAICSARSISAGSPLARATTKPDVDRTSPTSARALHRAPATRSSTASAHAVTASPWRATAGGRTRANLGRRASAHVAPRSTSGERAVEPSRLPVQSTSDRTLRGIGPPAARVSASRLIVQFSRY
jgi:hypothetical protein